MTSYPIRGKGQPRQLDPNWEGIDWLEQSTQDNTKVVFTYAIEAYGLTGQTAHGSLASRSGGNHPRRMFDILEDDGTPTGISYSPCAACLDFSRSWACTEHYELDWDHERRVFSRPRPRVVRPAYGSDHAMRLALTPDFSFTADIEDGVAQVLEAIRAITQSAALAERPNDDDTT